MSTDVTYPNECCADLDNREAPESPEGAPEGAYFTRCKVCGCRHFEIEVDPVKLGLKIVDM